MIPSRRGVFLSLQIKFNTRESEALTEPQQQQLGVAVCWRWLGKLEGLKGVGTGGFVGQMSFCLVSIAEGPRRIQTEYIVYIHLHAIIRIMQFDMTTLLKHC